ncbi:MAG: PaaI family thioesterase [Proteobacteria bacterium]|nr:PaaI family thioesterase [Pseudomonadota bacterium]
MPGHNHATPGTRLNPAWVETALSEINNSPYYLQQSMKIVSLEYGAATAVIEVGRKHLQPHLNVHGGVFSGLIDSAGFWAAFTTAPDGADMTTAEMKLSYLAPAAEGHLICEARIIKAGRTISLAEARVENTEGRLLAHGTVTLMTLSNGGGRKSFGGLAKFVDSVLSEA